MRGRVYAASDACLLYWSVADLRSADLYLLCRQAPRAQACQLGGSGVGEYGRALFRRSTMAKRTPFVEDSDDYAPHSDFANQAVARRHNRALASPARSASRPSSPSSKGSPARGTMEGGSRAAAVGKGLYRAGGDGA